MTRVAGRVSVVVPAYNHELFIRDAIESVQAQTYSDVEIVVADDGSRDRTAAVIKGIAERDPRIVPVLSRTNQGIAANHNRALDRCSGEYIALLSGDDLMFPDKLAKQVAWLEVHPECGVCTHDMEVFDSRSGRTLYRMNDRFAPKDGGLAVTFTTNWLFGRDIKSIPSSHMFRASAVGGLRYDERLRIMNEWLFEIDCLATSGLRWGSLPDVLGRYRTHDRQSSRSEEAFRLGFEEAMMVLAIAGVRYPQLAPLIKNNRDFIVFRHLVFDWFAEQMRPAYERQFRLEAGALKGLYMRAARLVVRQSWLLEASRPARRLVRWLVDRASRA